MKIAIVGAGVTGAYLYRILRNRGDEADIFDEKQTTRCGISPCAWGTSKGFDELVRASGLDPEKYVFRRFGHVWIDELKVRADLTTFDKPGLIRDLLREAEVQYASVEPSRYDRVIDASGVSRAFLPPIEDDVVLPAVQVRMETDDPLENRIRLGGVGYAWCFPLSEKEYHIGCGSLTRAPDEVLQDLGWIRTHGSGRKGKTICSCRGRIRLTGPQYALPFVIDKAGEGIWGVGEAIGCVAPLAGDGVVPGMRSVQLLMKSWNDPARYTEEIQREFSWMKRERRVIDKLRKGRRLSIKDALVLRGNARRMGMKIGIREAGMLLRRLQS